MEHFTTAIIGGGAAGLFLACKLTAQNEKVLLLERNDRLGKKLSATGNGQGNITNLAVTATRYFTMEKTQEEAIRKMICEYDDKHLCDFLRSLGVLLLADERGRVYPAGRQASAITDALRFFIAKKVDVHLQAKVVGIEKTDGKFILTAEKTEGQICFSADNVVLCAGGKAAKNFGTDGNGYELARRFSHTVTKLYPSLVQMKTETEHIKTLRGIRVNDGGVKVLLGEREEFSLRGDIIFTEYGVSGDGIFRASSYFAHKIEKGVTLVLDFLPDFTKEEIIALLKEKHKNFPEIPVGELLCGVLNNQVGRSVMKRANGDIEKGAEIAKAFSLKVLGSLGFDYAQVTKGGISLEEVDEGLQSKQTKGLYFAGEILDVDGVCGGYNLQWAYSSACVVAKTIKKAKE